MIQSNYGTAGNDSIEAVVSDGAGLTHHWFNGTSWTTGGVVARNVPSPLIPPTAPGASFGTPVLIQSNFGRRGNFEVVVALEKPTVNPFDTEFHGFKHFWRNNENGSLPWIAGGEFGARMSGRIGLIQSQHSAGGRPPFNNLEFVVSRGGLKHMSANPGRSWGP